MLLCYSYTETIHDIVLLPVFLDASQKIFSFFVTDHQFSFTDIISTRMLHFIRNTSLFLFYYNIALLRGCDFSCLCTISSYLHKSTSIHTIGHNSDHVSDESSQDFNSEPSHHFKHSFPIKHRRTLFLTGLGKIGSYSSEL